MPLEPLGWNAHWQRVFAAHARPGHIEGRILAQHRSHLTVATPAGETSAEIPGRLWNAAAHRTDLPGVGDFVALTPAAGVNPAVIEVVLPRTSALIRRAAGERRPQLIAANVDIVFIVTALDGDFSSDRIERYLKLVRDGGAEPVIVINKADIGAPPEPVLAELGKTAPAVLVEVVSARDPASIARLASHFSATRTIALIGSSGVGKSTLTNALLGRDAQLTGAVSTNDNRGRHTTTHRELFARPAGGAVMDTPGMAGLDLWDAPSAADGTTAPVDDFTDIETLATQCRFRNCAHASEPACAIQRAIASGELDAARLTRYLASL